MPDLEPLIREYCDLLEQERRINERKDVLKRDILKAMDDAKLAESKTPAGSATRSSRFKLTPHREPVLSLLDSEDLFPFAQFTPAKVTEHLVPRFGREALLPLFAVEKSVSVLIKRLPGPRTS